ncbi:MAG: GNAT family N-acetyltransferase [Gemmatimonadota bacterium]|nr:hypothetical protein [Gemmatimonadota bacterium]MDP6528225.1 GNAT family N-acetyltransferase [Gemmatimonadota bacterium]MDP6803094.1 GNAT family N-acetyltransferase [Gemmatimonadota bacterium]MDP7031867.1 GNAT family N-acetyltransferase [Gemmatimonadota bacterium]
MQLVSWNDRDPAPWDGFVDRVGGLIFHRRSFLGYHPPERFQEHHLAAMQGDKIQAVISLAESEDGGGRLLRTPYGGSFGGWAGAPSLSGREHLELVDLLMEYTRHHGFQALVYSAPPAPYRTAGDWVSFALGARGAVITAREVTHIVPLNSAGDPPRLREATRRAARKATRAGTTVRRASAGELPAFYALLDADRRAKSSRPTHTLEELSDLFGRHPEDFLLFVAESGGELVGGNVVIVTSPKTALSFYPARSATPASDGCMHLLGLSVISATRDLGLDWLDLGTSSIDGELSAGLCQFKEGQGALPFLRETWRI